MMIVARENNEAAQDDANWTLSLHQMTALEVGPVRLVHLAAALGCPKVSIFTHSPPMPHARGILPHGFPVLRQAAVSDFSTALRETGVTVHNAEFFPIYPDFKLDDFRDGIALAQLVGAERLVTHIHDTDRVRAVRSLDALAICAADAGMTTAVEFVAMSKACGNIAQAMSIIDELANPHVGMAIDALHLVRSGSTVKEMAALAPCAVLYAQICDGADLSVSERYLDEAFNRMSPGEGKFPLHEFVQALPDRTTLEVEVPQIGRSLAGTPADVRAHEAVAATREILAAVTNAA